MGVLTIVYILAGQVTNTLQADEAEFTPRILEKCQTTWPREMILVDMTTQEDI